MSNRRFLFGLALALTILLVSRLPLLRCGAFGSDVPNFADEVNYVWLADSLASGNTIADTYWFRSRAPATAALLLGLGWLRGVPPELAICDFQIVQVVLWVAILCAIVAMAATLWGRRTALLAALLLALLPDAAMLTLLVYSETLFTTALVAVVGSLLAWSRRPQFGWLIAAGVAAGVGALARPTMVPLVPVFALVVLMTKDERRKTKDESQQGSGFRPSSSVFRRFQGQLLSTAILIISCALVIAPWTIRNYRLYGGFILIDTTGSVVLWSDNKPEGSDTVKDDIQLASTNPVERQRFATREALATIGADPGRFARKVVRESIGAWGPADFDWTAGYWGDLLQRNRLAALLAQWHSVMLLTIPLALLGLCYSPHYTRGARGYRLGLAGICIVYTFMIGITHFEERYRTPFMVVLLPYAAWSLAHPRTLAKRMRQPLGLALVIVLIGAGIYYSQNLWPDQWTNGQALVLHGRGYLRAALGDPQGALADQERATTLMSNLYEAPVAAAQLHAAQGDERTAEELLRTTISVARNNHDEPTIAVIALQKLLAQHADWAATDEVDSRLSIRGRQEAETALWGKGAPPGSQITLGTGDLGLAKGFYLSEAGAAGGRFRWSRPSADVLLAGRGATVCLRLNAARPLDLPAPVITMSVRTAQGGWQQLGSIRPPRSGWVWGCAPATGSDAPWTLRLETTAYSPFMHNQGSDTRQLGVALAEVVVRKDTPSIDPATSLAFDRLSTSVEQTNGTPLTLIGINGTLRGRSGQPLPLTLWWRGAQPPPAGTFTFVHLLDSSGATVAAYNAPLAGGSWLKPWTAGEPLADPVALPLPAGLAPGTYRLQVGAFEAASGTMYVQAELGEVEVR